jgi:hypothetical protein
MTFAPGTKLIAVSRAKPCAICGGDHKCSRGEDGLLLCGRPPSLEQLPGFRFIGRASNDPQFALYRRDDDPMLYQIRRRPSVIESQSEPSTNGNSNDEPRERVIDWEARCREHAGHLTAEERQRLAETLGLPQSALADLEIGFTGCGPHKDEKGKLLGPCWTFPEVDAAGRVIGITCRYRDGTKKAWPGGKRGLTVPEGWTECDGPIILAEGASDVLALTALGLAAVGRPNNAGELKHLTDLLRDLPAQREIVVLGEYDPKPDGSWPGRDGAKNLASKLAESLSSHVSWALPPEGAKDARAWVLSQNLGASRPDARNAIGEQFLAKLARNLAKAAQDNAEPGGERVDEVDASELVTGCPCPKLEYLPLLGRDGYIVEGWSNLLAGYPRCGKTDLITACCPAWLAAGTTILYMTEESRPIWEQRLAQSPGSWQGMRLKFALGAQPLELLERMAKGEESVVIVDSIRNLGILPPDENANAAVAAAIAPWVAKARSRGKTLLFVHHMRKGAGEHGEGISGAHALLGAVDLALEIRRENQPNRRLIRAYARLIQPPDLLYERQEDNRLVAIGDPHAVGQAEVQRRVLEVLDGEWAKTEEIRNKLGDPKPSAEQLRKALLTGAEAGRLERDPPLTVTKTAGKTLRWRRPA